MSKIALSAKNLTKVYEKSKGANSLFKSLYIEAVKADYH